MEYETRLLSGGRPFGIPLSLMKLVIVDRSRAGTYDRMCHLFGNDPNVAVVLDRRSPDDRRQQAERRAQPRAAQDRRLEERRQKVTEFGPRGFIIIDVDATGT